MDSFFTICDKDIHLQDNTCSYTVELLSVMHIFSYITF